MGGYGGYLNDTCPHIMYSFNTSKWPYTLQVLDEYVYAFYVFVLHVYYSSSKRLDLYTCGVKDGYVQAYTFPPCIQPFGRGKRIIIHSMHTRIRLITPNVYSH